MIPELFRLLKDHPEVELRVQFDEPPVSVLRFHATGPVTSDTLAVSAHQIGSEASWLDVELLRLIRRVSVVFSPVATEKKAG